MMKTTTLAGLAAATLMLTACTGGQSQEPPTYTSTYTETVSAAEEVTDGEDTPWTGDDEPELDISNEDLGDMAMSIAWEGMTTTEQDNICLGLELDEETMLDIFMTGVEDSEDVTITRTMAKDFFDGVCI